MNKIPDAAHQFRSSGASCVFPSYEGSPVEPVTHPVVNGSVELMDSGGGQSVLTRNVQVAGEVQTFGHELSQHDHTENAIRPSDNRARQTPTRQCEEDSLPAPHDCADLSDHADWSNPLNEPPAASHYDQIEGSYELLESDPASANRASGKEGESAAREGNEQAVEQSLKAVDMVLPEVERPKAAQGLRNATDDDGQNSLQFAIEQNYDIDAILLRDAQQELPQTAGPDPHIPEAYDPPDSCNHPASEPDPSNCDTECVGASRSGSLLDRLWGNPVIKKDAEGRTPLNRAAQEGKSERLMGLLREPGILVLINEKDKDGRTPLCAAARDGNPNCVKQLLSVRRTRVNEKTNTGQTPLHLAACKGNTGCVKALLSVQRTRVNEKTNTGQTPLHLAARKGNTGCIKVLLGDSRIQVNEKDNDGKTPLCLAALEGHVKCV